MNAFIHDLRWSARMLFKKPMFTLVIVATLALGIGVNTAIFSIVDGILLRPLPYPCADRLVALHETNPELGGFMVAAPPNVEDWADQSRTIEQFGLGREWPFIYKGDSGVEGVDGGLATPELFMVFGLKPALGRLFAREDLELSNNHIVVLSHQLWRDRFGGDPNIVDRTLMLNNEPYVVAGVLPEGASVAGLDAVQLWTPLHFDPREPRRRGWRGFLAYGRLAPDVALDDARREMDTIAARLALQYPDTNAGWGVRIDSLHDRIVGNARRTLTVFTCAAALVLLICCANAANLLLAHVADRRRELSIRAAMGAGAFRITRMLLTESMLISALGGAAGVLLAVWAVDAIKHAAPPGVPRIDEASIDGRILGFAILITMATSLLSGLIPALNRCGGALFESLKSDQRAGARSSFRARDGLIISEVALSVMLLIGAGLLTRSFAALNDWRPGFDRSNLAVVWLYVSGGKYAVGRQAPELFARAAEAAESLPEVVSAGTACSGPLFGGHEPTDFSIVGRPDPSPDQPQVANLYDIGAGYLQTLATPLLRGRYFTDQDTFEAPKVMIINEAMARRYWPDENPIDHEIVVAGDKRKIVGVVSDIKPLRPGAPTPAEAYWPARQTPRSAAYLVVRTNVDPRRIERTLRARLRSLDSDMQISDLQTLDQRLDRAIALPRFRMMLLGLFALTALLLASIGIYGVVNCAVIRRRREMGVRIALGAGEWRIHREVIVKYLTPVATGLVFGLVGAFGLSRLLASMLYGIETNDPTTFAGVALILSLTALTACYFPARRAAQIEPMTALRCE